MLIAKKQSRILIALLLSMGLFLQIASGDIGQNPQCTSDANKKYQKNFGTDLTCISKDECKALASDSQNVYLTGSDEYVCKNTGTSCEMKYNNKPGYIKATTGNFNECTECPKDKPISNGTQCEQCSDGTIFTYVKLDSQSSLNPCVTLQQISSEYSAHGKGVFSLDEKIYYEDTYTCPANSIKSTVTLEGKTFNKCICSFKTPVIKDGITCSECSFGQIADEATNTCVESGKCSKYLSIDGKLCYQSSCPGTEAYDENSKKCIEYQNCQGFYEEGQMKRCLKDTCRRTKATVDKAANYFLTKSSGQLYEVCKTCSDELKFVQASNEPNPTNECKKCENSISDFVSGKCSTLDEIKLLSGVLDEDKQIFYPADKYTCINFLSIDQSICYKSGCPLGQYYKASSVKQCDVCAQNKYPSADQTQCVSSCGEGEVLDEKTKVCIRFGDCDGYYDDIDKTICLAKPCQRLKATKNLPASILLSKVGNEKYQVCKTCPPEKSFVKIANSSSPTIECINCGGQISDFVSGFCSTQDNISTPGILDDLKKNFYPLDQYTCKSGYYPVKQFNSQNVVLSVCSECPSTTPLSDGISCKNACPTEKIFVNFETKQCDSACPSDFYQDREKFAGSNFYYCYRNCPEDKLSFSPKDGKKECIKQEECTLKVSSDNKQCISDCNDNQYALSVGNLTICQASLCQGKQFIFSYKNYNICSDNCNYFLTEKQNGNLTEKKCLEVCPIDQQYALERQGNETFQKCTNECPNYLQVNKQGVKECSSTCTQYLYTGSKQCQTACQDGHFINEQQQNETFRKCSATCVGLFSYTDKQTVKYCLSKCPPQTFISIDTQGQKSCIPECTTFVSDTQVCQSSCTDYVQDKVSEEQFTRCSTTCDGLIYQMGNAKRCSKSCPEGQIPFISQQKCFKTQKECPNFISVKGDECIDICVSEKYEYPKEKDGFKQCVTCQGYYSSSDQSCTQTCDIGQIAIPSVHSCYSKSLGTIHCKNLKLKLSSDQSKCTPTCQYPDMEDSSGACKLPCDPQDTSCSDCSNTQFILGAGNKQTCVNSCGDLFISSNKKRCVKDCSIIKEKSPQSGKACIKCLDDEVLVLDSSKANTYVCKKSNSLDILTDKVNYAKEQLKTQIDSISSLQAIKDQVAEIAKDTFKKAQESKDKSSKQLIDEVINLAKKTVSNIGITELQNIPHKIGSKDNIIVQLQTKATGYKFKSNLDIQQIQTGKNYSLMEEITDGKEETLPSLATSVLAFNPACQNESCKAYPLFQLDTTVIAGRLLLEAVKDFTVTFNLKDSTDIQKYTCLSYDLTKPTQTPVITKTTILSDNKSISCLVSGSVSIFLDSNCQYINKSLCPNKEIDNSNNNEINDSDDDDGLNGGQIAGIVIGVIVFIGIVAIIFIQLVKHKKQKAQKKYQDPQNNQKNNHQQLQTESNHPLNTQGTNNQINQQRV